MSSTHYDRIIDRYINGQMKPAEEEDFRKLLELDDELRRLFEADRRMNATLLKERGALASLDHPESYSRFLMGLAASVPSGSELSGTTGSVAAASASHVAPLLLGGLGLLLAGALSLFWLTNGAVKTSPARPGDTIGARRAAPVSPPSIEPSLPEQMTDGKSTDTMAPADAAIDRNAPTAIGEEPRGEAPIARKTPPQEPAVEPAATSAEPSQPKARGERRRDDIPTFVDDTIRTRVKVEHSDR